MFIDFLRALQGQLFDLVIFLVIVIIGGLIVRRKVSPNLQIRKYVGWSILALIGIAVLIVAVRAAHMASVNEIPRKVIDRSDVKQDAEAFQQNVEKNTDASTTEKTAEGAKNNEEN